MKDHSPVTQRQLLPANETLVIFTGFAVYLGLRLYHDVIATGQMQAAMSLAEWAFGAGSKLQSVLLMNLLLDVPFAMMSGFLIAAILIGLKPRSLMWSSVAVALLGEAAWLFIWDTLTNGWIVASRTIAVLGLLGGCFWLQQLRKYLPSEISRNKNAPGHTRACAKTAAQIG